MGYVPKPKREIECAQCGEIFRSSFPTAKYCSKACQMKAYRRRTPKEIRKCGYCGKEFHANFVHQKYCTPACGSRKKAEDDKRRRAEIRKKRSCGLKKHGSTRTICVVAIPAICGKSRSSRPGK